MRNFTDFTYGEYITREEENLPPELEAEWETWLEAQRDPGNYESYKDKTVKPPIWSTKVFMPGFLLKKLMESRKLPPDQNSEKHQPFEYDPTEPGGSLK